jgi:hypothetical protein
MKKLVFLVVLIFTLGICHAADSTKLIKTKPVPTKIIKKKIVPNEKSDLFLYNQKAMMTPSQIAKAKQMRSAAGE